MSAVIFAGPSVPKEVQGRYDDFTFLPPVRQGEICRVVAEKPSVIGIIDGFFDGVPAVLHKEILWALSAGIPVFGASSMGALRAAELHTFGMTGVGRIFEDYRDGILTGDDEVALQHGPPETGYVLLSEPLVNIRATLDRAVAENVLDPKHAECILELARKQFYQHRTWSSVTKAMVNQIDKTVCDAFADWLPEGKYDQKQRDAELLLATVDQYLSAKIAPVPSSFAFEWTEAWDEIVWQCQTETQAGLSEQEEAILNELRLTGDTFRRVREKALARLLAEEGAQQRNISVEHHNIRQAETDFRTAQGMYGHADLEKWGRKNQVTTPKLDRIIKDQATVDVLAQHRISELSGRMIDQLRLDGAYRKLDKRARKKAKGKSAGAADEPSLLHPTMLVAWYFESHLGVTIPRDLAAHVSGLGLQSEAQFHRMLMEEYVWQNRNSDPAHSGANSKM